MLWRFADDDDGCAGRRPLLGAASSKKWKLLVENDVVLPFEHTITVDQNIFGTSTCVVLRPQTKMKTRLEHAIRA